MNNPLTVNNTTAYIPVHCLFFLAANRKQIQVMLFCDRTLFLVVEYNGEQFIWCSHVPKNYRVSL
uniref:Uncharacterized protein n=1 Tax=Anguilla anguilla TaxID=7936 RepID=A0A0E9WTS6_ANGAN